MTAGIEEPQVSGQVPEIQLASQETTDKTTDKTTYKTSLEKKEHDVETGSVESAVKGYYSKVSVWLMVLFSGLAIGSDG